MQLLIHENRSSAASFSEMDKLFFLPLFHTCVENDVRMVQSTIARPERLQGTVDGYLQGLFNLTGS